MEKTKLSILHNKSAHTIPANARLLHLDPSLETLICNGAISVAYTYGLCVGKEMNKLTALAIFFTCQVFGTPTDEELLQLERITEHKESFVKIEAILSKAGFRKAKINDVTNPTLHFDRFIEWAYFIQPVYKQSKNELLVGYDEEGRFDMSGIETLQPLCKCPGNNFYRKRGTEMNQAIEMIWELHNSANKAADTTATNAAVVSP